MQRVLARVLWLDSLPFSPSQASWDWTQKKKFSVSVAAMLPVFLKKNIVWFLVFLVFMIWKYKIDLWIISLISIYSVLSSWYLWHNPPANHFIFWYDQLGINVSQRKALSDCTLIYLFFLLFPNFCQQSQVICLSEINQTTQAKECFRIGSLSTNPKMRESLQRIWHGSPMLKMWEKIPNLCWEATMDQNQWCTWLSLVKFGINRINVLAVFTKIK